MTNITEQARVSDGTEIARTEKEDDPRAAKFVTAYLANRCNARQAALATGSTEASAGVTGHRMLKKDNVRRLIQERLAEKGLTEERLLVELIDVGLEATLEGFWDFLDTGSKPDPKDLRRAKSMTVSTVKTTTKSKTGVETTTTKTTRRVELHDRVSVLQKLLEHVAGVQGDNVPEGGGEIRQTIFEYIRAKVRSVDIGLPSGVPAEPKDDSS